jgi:WS/DGAT/MGAT family acyltransferase
MKPLTGLDAMFLSTETSSMHNHVCGTFVFDPSTMPKGYNFETFRQLVLDRLPLLPPFRRRVLNIPFGLHHPIWIEDPDFDLDYHVRRASLPSPGSVKELGEFTADIVGRPLDLTRPLWELYMVEGLEDGMIAMVTKTHHAAIDGVSGAELMANFLDLSNEIRPIEKEDPTWKPDRIPSDLELIAYGLNALAKHPMSIARTFKQTVDAMLNLSQRNRMPGISKPPPAPFSAPKTKMNGALTPHRKVTFTEISLDDVKFIKNVFAGTVNDVVLTICGTALRNYLIEHKDLPEKDLVAMIPISVRTEDQKGTMGNRVSMMLVSLETSQKDPIKRLSSMSENSKIAKEQEKAIGAETLSNWTEFAAPAVAARAARLISSSQMADRLRPIFNLIISNVPGPNFPLFAGGAKMLAAYPIGPLIEGVGLNVTVMSYMGSMFFGLQSCRELIPDIDKIGDYLVAATSDLHKAATRKQNGQNPSVRAVTRKPRPGSKSAQELHQKSKTSKNSKSDS